jgi:hypothetical protein
VGSLEYKRVPARHEAAVKPRLEGRQCREQALLMVNVTPEACCCGSKWVLKAYLNFHFFERVALVVLVGAFLA